MKTKSIYPASNSLRLKKIMAKYTPSEILYVPIDVAKYNHKACCINFFGDILRPAFEFPNNSHGVDFFISKVTHVARTSGIKKILMGLESTGHYHRNLTLRLRALGHDVAVINPFDSWKERLNKNAKTDKIDLGSIAKALISGKFSSSYVPGGVYYNLRRATRTRRKFISRRGSSQNVITGLMDQLFPGLWDKDDSIFSDRWGKGSLLVIERYPTSQRILRLGEARLARFLRKNNTKLTEKTARKIISAARCSLASNNPCEQTMDILALRSHIKVYRLYQEIIANLENEIAHLVAQTPGVYLLSIPGISVIYGAEITAEIGDISRFAYAKQIISSAGTCSKKKQTGEYDPQGLPMSKKGNKFLRTSLNQAALSLNAWCPDFNAYYTRKLVEKADKKGIARTATGNKLARLAFALMKHEVLYRPHTLNSLTSNLRGYYIALYGKILKKLDRFSSEKILPKDNYLEQIKRKLEKQYAVDLSKLSESI